MFFSNSIAPGFQSRFIKAIRLISFPLLLLACNSDGGGSGPHFLVASAKGLTEMRGTSERLLLEYADGSFIFDPAVSKDGKRIAFALQPPASIAANGNVDFGSDLYVAKRDGSNPELALRHSRVGEFIRSPAWLNDDEVLINVRGRAPNGLPDLRIEQFNLRTGARQRFIENAIELALSPDDKSLAYVFIDPETQAERLTVRDLQGGTPQSLLPATSTLVLITSLVWSPDGSQIAFAAADPATGAAPRTQDPASATLHPSLQDVRLVNRDGSNLRLLSDLAESQPSIAWAEDGKSLYVVGTAGFWRLDAQTGAREQIGPGIPFSQIVRLE